MSESDLKVKNGDEDVFTDNSSTGRWLEQQALPRNRGTSLYDHKKRKMQ